MARTKRPLFVSLAALAVLSLSSCSIYSLVPSFSSGAGDPDFSHTFVQDGVCKSDDFLKTTLQDVSLQRGMVLPPSTGEVNVLVLPIEFTNYEFSDDDLDNVEQALNGMDMGYWESVASFYEKSSYGKLHLNFHVASIYKTGMTPENAAKANYSYSKDVSSDKSNGQLFVNEAVEAYDDASYPLTDFDQDDDGIIDAVVAVYSCPDYESHSYYFDKGLKDSSLFWAYTYWCLNNGDLSSPKANTYVWLSSSFFSAGGKADPHTLIHEYGHAMGLDDYYSNETAFQPTGGIDMMDMNVTDHDVYSKCALGWTSPYIVSGDDVTITIRPSESSGDCVLISTSSFNGTLWDEYMLLELYTPTGLNELDSKTKYRGSKYNYPKGYGVPGIKIYHIDSRLIACYAEGNSYVSTPYVEKPNSIDTESDDVCYLVGATNCSKEYNSSMILSSNRDYSSDFSLIHLMEAGGVNTFKDGAQGTNATLFQKGSSFSFDKFGRSFFPNKVAMNNGCSFPYTIEVTALSSDSATLHISK